MSIHSFYYKKTQHNVILNLKKVLKKTRVISCYQKNTKARPLVVGKITNTQNAVEPIKILMENIF